MTARKTVRKTTRKTAAKASTVPEFKAGDVVQIRSGGPAMTSSGRWSDGSYRCHWFIDGIVQEHSFDEDLLRLF